MGLFETFTGLVGTILWLVVGTTFIDFIPRGAYDFYIVGGAVFFGLAGYLVGVMITEKLERK